MNASEAPVYDRPEQEDAEYRSLCGLAVIAAGLAVLSLSAWMSMVMWCVSLMGAVVAIIALRRIAKSDPPMLGRGLALAALFVSVICTVGPVADEYTYRTIVRREAQEFAKYWFDLQLNRNVETASLLVEQPGIERRSLPFKYRSVSEQEMADLTLMCYRNLPEIQAILALSGKAQIRYYDTERQDHVGHEDRLRQVYAVTYDKKGTKTTFFIRLMMERRVPANNSVGIWKIVDFQGGIKPIALGGVDDI